MDRIFKLAIAAVVTFGAAAVPTISSAQSRSQLQHRQKMKNQWRNLGYAGAAVGTYGLLKGDKTLGVAGLAGGAYAASRYEQDRKSQRRMQDQRRRYGYRRHRAHRHHSY